MQDATVSVNQLENIVLDDDDTLTENDFAEMGIQPQFVSILWLLSSTPPTPQMLRETVA